jgi:hypothetical protein
VLLDIASQSYGLQVAHMSLTDVQDVAEEGVKTDTHEKADAMLNRLWLWETISFPVSTVHDTSPPLSCIHAPTVSVWCHLCWPSLNV